MNPTRCTSRPRTIRSFPALLLAAALLAPGCASTEEDQLTLAQVEDAAFHERFEEAVRLADQLRAKHPEDREVAEAHRLATVGYYLERGRRATFQEADLEALDWFRDALEIAPENPLVQEWIRKTRNKVATRWLRKAQEAYASDDLPAALEAYRQALDFKPNDESALQGLAKLTILVNYRDGLGVQYYNDGVRALADYWLQQARRGFSVSKKFLPENERAERRITEVDILLSNQRVAVADGLERQGLYAGALNEYGLALALDPGNQEAELGIARLADEAAAAQFLREAQMKVHRAEFDQANELLDEGEKLTKVQGDLFQQTREEIVTARLQRIYDSALNLEHDQLYEEAIAGYGQLLEQADFFKDSRTRKETLESYVEQAGAYYEEAMEQTDPELKLLSLRAIAGFWPEYKDIPLQIKTLEKQVGPRE